MQSKGDVKKMSERRMFSKAITESDAFLDMSFSAQALYFHLSLNADDEGFINNSRRILRICGFSEKDLEELLNKSFLIKFDSGIYVIKHWKVNNKIRNDRIKGTNYPEEKSMLIEKATGVYSKVENVKGSLPETDNVKSSENVSDKKEVLVEPVEDVSESEKVTTEKVEKNEIAKQEVEHNEKIAFDLESEPRKDYAGQVFDILFANNLPCANGNEISFYMRDFKLALPALNKMHLHSNDVIQAVKNYAEVIKLKRQGLSWWTSEQTFFNFCDKKTILQFIPESFQGTEHYLKDKKSNDSEMQSGEPKIQL